MNFSVFSRIFDDHVLERKRELIWTLYGNVRLIHVGDHNESFCTACF